MMTFVIAAMLGAVVRYLADYYLPRHGILIVHMIGSCIAGIAVSLALLLELNEMVMQAIVGGFAGSLTTFSTVAVQAAQQRLDKTASAAKIWALHTGLSVTACLTGACLTLLFLH